MVDYFNAKNLLPPEVLSKVLSYIPEESRCGTVIYFSDDFYARRNFEIISLFRIYQAAPHFGSHTEIYEALAEQFGLTPRQICRILEGNREPGPERKKRACRTTGIRVDRASRRMRVFSPMASP